MSTAEPREGCDARRHGDAAAYTWAACRCADAREDWRIRSKRRRQGRAVPRLVDATGTARRLQALAALGWTLADVAGHLHVNARRVHHVQTMGSPTVLRTTAETVERVYDVLSMTIGPSDKTARIAKRNRWVPPLAWDDDEIDDPAARPATGPRRWSTPPDQERIVAALAGDEAARRALTGADRQQLVRQLHADGLLDPEICKQTGLSRRLVQYLRAQMCLPSNDPGDVAARSGLPPIRNASKGAA